MILIKTSRDKLLKPLQMVTGIVEKRQTFPILSNVLIQKKSKIISFLTSDIDIQVNAIFQVENDQDFALTVSAKKLQDILRSLDEDAVITFIRKEEKLQVKSGKSIFSLQILPPEKFPVVSEDKENASSIVLQQNTFKTLLNHVHYAIAEQDIRYYLNGVLLSIENTQLDVVGTDTHQLAHTTTTIEPTNINQKVILPRKTVLELIKLLNDNDAPITIDFFPKIIKFTFSNITLLSKLIDGNYPNYKRVIPTQNEKKFDIDRLNFLHALQRVSILSDTNDKFRPVRLIIDKEKLSIICKNNEQEAAIEEIAIEYDESSIDINLNITYLMSLLNHLLTKSIRFSFAEVSNSVLITIPDRDDFNYVIKPVKI